MSSTTAPRARSKVYASAHAALADLASGIRLMSGGFGLCGIPENSIDVIAENLMLPQLDSGDLIIGRAMGAYTWASASEFNFFPRATVVSVNLTAGDRGSVLRLDR